MGRSARLKQLLRRRNSLPYWAVGQGLLWSGLLLMMGPALMGGASAWPFGAAASCAAVGAGFIAAQFVRIWRQLRRAQLHDGLVCPRCGYLLVNHTDAEPCPECGERWTRQELDVFWRM
jgi:hypothetical protein